MGATSGNTGSGDPDPVLIGELMEEMSRHPPAIGARKLLVEHYISVGWLEAAIEYARELKNLVPGDADVTKFLYTLQKKSEPPLPEKLSPPLPEKKLLPPLPTAPAAERLEWDPKSGQYIKTTAPRSIKRKPDISVANVSDDLDTARQDLAISYQTLQAKARFIVADLMHLQALQKKAGILPSKDTAKIQQIVEGQVHMSGQLCAPRATARAMRDSPKDATSIAIADMEEAMRWHKGLLGQSSNANINVIRDALVKRKAALEVTLSDELKVHCEIALMHLEHEHLKRNYANTETMYGDEVSDIPRSRFFVTEDNYAWDMDELVAAIKAGSGVLRNPLSKQMFTPKDVTGIYMHPLAKPLAALAVEQKDMSKGVRPETITRMEKLSEILLVDQSADTMPSRHAVDEFLAYIATRKYIRLHLARKAS